MRDWKSRYARIIWIVRGSIRSRAFFLFFLPIKSTSKQFDTATASECSLPLPIDTRATVLTAPSDITRPYIKRRKSDSLLLFRSLDSEIPREAVRRTLNNQARRCSARARQNIAGVQSTKWRQTGRPFARAAEECPLVKLRGRERERERTARLNSASRGGGYILFRCGSFRRRDGSDCIIRRIPELSAEAEEARAR